MSSVRATGAGMPNMLRINGQEVTTVPSSPVEGPRPAGGTPATTKPVPGPANSAQAQEQAFDLANEATLRGQMAADMIQGKKPKSKRDVTKKNRNGEVRADHKRIDGIFPEGDPSNKQEQAFEEAALFEEKVKETDLSFKRKAGQVEVSSQVFRADIDDGKGALVMGESSRELSFSSMMSEDDTHANPAPNIEIREDTVPNFELPVSSETNLRKVLGLKKK